MLECFDCGTLMCVLTPRDLLARVAPENRFEVRQLLRRYGRNCIAYMCPTCRTCGLEPDTPLAESQTVTQ